MLWEHHCKEFCPVTTTKNHICRIFEPRALLYDVVCISNKAESLLEGIKTLYVAEHGRIIHTLPAHAQTNTRIKQASLYAYIHTHFGRYRTYACVHINTYECGKVAHNILLHLQIKHYITIPRCFISPTTPCGSYTMHIRKQEPSLSIWRIVKRT
jgi:hypothetical protein